VTRSDSYRSPDIDANRSVARAKPGNTTYHGTRPVAIFGLTNDSQYGL
jgi:hypothetical protein